MPAIEIDFEVFKALTARRESEAVTCNHVIRSLLGLPAAPMARGGALAESLDVWVCKGVRFPIGTEFRAHYKGRLYSGTVAKDGIVINGARASSPSDAARLVTHTNVNGWIFWTCRFPGEAQFCSLRSLRDGS